jgi:hypothetical protein
MICSLMTFFRHFSTPPHLYLMEYLNSHNTLINDFRLRFHPKKIQNVHPLNVYYLQHKRQYFKRLFCSLEIIA